MTAFTTKIMIGQRFLFDPKDNSLVDQHSDDDVIRLGSNESRVLCLLIEEPGSVVSRQQLHEYVWREQGFEVDDSSLTQAISTLRKLLKDPTKSPEFIKTVPKRGYQFISTAVSLEPKHTTENKLESIHSASSLVAENVSSTSVQVSNAPSFSASPDANIAHKNTADTDKTVSEETPKKVQNKITPLGWFLICIAIILPILAFTQLTPKSSAFEQVAVYNNVPVMVPTNHPDISRWQPLIEKCVNNYQQHHEGNKGPVEVIATGGQKNQLLVLNYIHSTEHLEENITVRLLINQKEVTNVCG
ncbi:transcriptional regulator [Vibrio sp. Of7-15]|uniref:winged helix-turn-helix domain-containing protein n=1 Tax=Vibrio sp. Of7-15 TaxID=2724879 RepID=UPI001EF22C76|nr:transcriptional regulator [Vibrio sp. Of7-15]MCG7495758.1 transcriptional regulator [Vibrio sp. Of7-15]